MHQPRYLSLSEGTIEESAYTTIVHVILEDVTYFEYAFLFKVFV